MAVAQNQCWTLLTYSFKINYCKSILPANVDAYSQLPLSTKHFILCIPAVSVLLLKQLKDFRMTRHMTAIDIDDYHDAEVKSW